MLNILSLLAINSGALLASLELMWKGMLAIFIVIVVILLAVLLLSRVAAKKQ